MKIPCSVLALALLTAVLGAQTSSRPLTPPTSRPTSPPTKQATAKPRPGVIAEGPARIEGLDFGKPWFGPTPNHRDLIGKVVLIEYWGS